MEGRDQPDLLRLITCGSVDDGKSTLIGRLLHETGALPADQRERLEADSRRFGTQGAAPDYALLLDGLAAEREQGITIDVAYRFFGTPRRRFIVADCPGHEQYTRNMATGASTAQAAVVLVDARKGLLTQTRRHSWIAALLGVRHFVLAVNKMDAIGYRQDVFDAIATEYRRLALALGIQQVSCIPLSALHGDNLVGRSDAMPWYTDASLLQTLEAVPVEQDGNQHGFCLPVQWVNRSGPDFRGYCGTVCGGRAQRGDAVVVLPSGRRTRIGKLLLGERELPAAHAGQAITVVLEGEIDVSRGDVIAATDHPPAQADQFAAHIVWMSEAPLLPGRSYLLKLAGTTVAAQVTAIKHRLDVNTQDTLAAKRLELNEIGVCNLSLEQPVVFAPYRENRALGGFILIDRISNETVACGMLDFALRRAGNIHWQALDVDRSARAAIKGQHPVCLWFTGLSGSGKSTIANLVEKRLHARGFHTFLLDGDNVRHGLSRDLGFSAEDRVENIRRIAEVARLMTDAGLVVLVSFISPYRSERRLARERFPDGDFLEVFVDAPLEVCEARDTKGLYRRARSGEIPNFTGIGAPYEPPEHAELRVPTAELTPAHAADAVLEVLLPRIG